MIYLPFRIHFHVDDPKTAALIGGIVLVIFIIDRRRKK